MSGFGDLVNTSTEKPAEVQEPTQESEVIDAEFKEVESQTTNTEEEQKVIENQSLEEHEVKLNVETSVKNGKDVIEEESKEETLAIPQIDTTEKPWATVSIKKGITLNLGDFESFRCDVSVAMPVKSEHVGKVTMESGRVIDARLATEVQKVRQKYKLAANSSFNSGY